VPYTVWAARLVAMSRGRPFLTAGIGKGFDEGEDKGGPAAGQAGHRVRSFSSTM